MGKSKHIERIRELFEKSPVVDFKSIKRIIRGKYAKLLVSNMVKSGEIRKMAKGYYSKHDDPGLAVLCFSPSYLGLQHALSFHGLWEQETIPVIITANKVRPGIREISGSNVLIRRSKRDYLFGFQYYKDGNHYLPYSDIEKTFIDMFVFNQPVSEEVTKEFKKRIENRKLQEYLKKYSRNIKKRVLEAYSR